MIGHICYSEQNFVPSRPLYAKFNFDKNNDKYNRFSQLLSQSIM